MGSAADEIAVPQSFEPVMWAEPEHLIEGVRQIEGCPPVHVVAVVPVIGGDDFPCPDVRSDALQSGTRFQERQYLLGEAFLFLFPADRERQVGHRNQDIDRRMPGRRQSRVGCRSVLNVERHIVGEAAVVEDILDVPPVVPGEKHVMVGYVVAAVDAEVEHEGRAGILHDVEVLPGVLRYPGADQVCHGIGEIGIDDNFVGQDCFSVCQDNTPRRAVFHQDALYRCAEPQRSAMLGEYRTHGARYCVEPADDVKNAIGVFHVGYDREGRRALPGRHSQVFCLECERQFELFRRKIVAEIVENGFPQREVRQSLQQVGGKN